MSHQSGHYKTSYPYPPQQHGQFPQLQPNTHSDRMPSHHAYPSYPEGSLQPQPSGRSPYAGPVPFPEPQRGSSASHQQPYFPPSQTTQNLTVPTHHQHERRGSHGHSDNQRLYPEGPVSDTGGGSNFYSLQPGVQPHYGGAYIGTAAQPQDSNAAVYEDAQGYGPRSIAPGVLPVGTHRRLHRTSQNPVFDERHDSLTKAQTASASESKPLCRYPRCGDHVFFDRRVNEFREWCSDEHMQAAITHRVEKPCNTCRVWPRRRGCKRCSGNVCRYPGHSG